jgi:hypothetical protein
MLESYLTGGLKENMHKWRAVCTERCTYGSEGGIGYPWKQGSPSLPYKVTSLRANSDGYSARDIFGLILDGISPYYHLISFFHGILLVLSSCFIMPILIHIKPLIR